MCTTSNETGTHCVTTARSTPENILPSLFPNLTTTPTTTTRSASTADLTSLLSGALTLQTHVFNPILAASGIVFLASVVTLFFLKRATGGNPRRAGVLRVWTVVGLCLSVAMGLTACLAVTEAVWALQYSPLLSGERGGEGVTVVRQGVALQVLQWFAFGLTVVFTSSVSWLVRGGGGGGEK